MSSSAVAEPPAEGAPPELPTRSELLKLYELVLLEYRFQILLNWDRSKQMLIFDGLLLGAAAGMHRLKPEGSPPLLVAALFALVVLTSVLGVAGVRRGHAYYREVRRVKSNYEKELGLPERDLALETTAGMIEANRPDRVPVKLARRVWRFAGKVTVHLEFLFWAITALAGVGFAATVM